MTSETSGALRAPLDEILGARANVQVLRILTRADAPMGRAEAARRAGVTPQGGRKALDRLFEVGMVQYVGSGKTKQVQLREQHPLASSLTDLFDAERQRHESLLQAIKSAADRVTPPPQAVWIQGPVAAGTDEYGDPLILGVLAAADEVDELSEELRNKLVELERRYDATIEVRPHTRADLVALQPDDIATIPVFGPGPAAFVANGESQRDPALENHEDHDQRALSRARRLADLLVANPGLRSRALGWLNEQLDQEEGNRELREWKRLLESSSIPRLRRLLTAETDRAVRLRQSLPFWPVLNDDEREMLLAETNDES